MTEVGIGRAREALRAAVGQYAWGVKRGADDVLTVEFGPPHLVIRHPLNPEPGSSQVVIDLLDRRNVGPRGKWHLMIYDGDWSIFSKSYSTKRFDRDTIRAAGAVRQLDGQKLLNVDYLTGVHAWRFEFDLGASLIINRTSPAEEGWHDEDQWILFDDEGKWIAFKNDLRTVVRD